MKTKTIHKPTPTKNFTTFHNEILQDERLSFAALGILTMMLSRPWDWETSVKWIYQQRKEGKRGVQKCLKELEALGYLRRERGTSEKGQFQAMVWHWMGEPSEAIPSAGNPSGVECATTKDRSDKEEKEQKKEKGKGGFVPKRTPWISQFPHSNLTEEDLERGMALRGVEYDPNRLSTFLDEMHLKGFRNTDGKPILDIIGFAIARQELCTPQDWPKPKRHAPRRREYTGGPF